MKRTSIIPPLSVCLLALSSGCGRVAQLQPSAAVAGHPTGRLVAQRQPSAPALSCSESWQPDYFANRPAGSPYSLVGSPTSVVATAAVLSSQPQAQPVAPAKASARP